MKPFANELAFKMAQAILSEAAEDSRTTRLLERQVWLGTFSIIPPEYHAEVREFCQQTLTIGAQSHAIRTEQTQAASILARIDETPA